MHPIIAKYIIYYPIQWIRNQNSRKYLKSIERIQFYPLENILQIRDIKINNLVKYAHRHIPFYKELYDNSSIAYTEKYHYEDLQKLPVLSKRIILENEKKMVVPQSREKLYTRKTGGSTGMTLHFKKNAKALALNDAIMWRCYKWYDIGVGDKQVRFWGVPVKAQTRLKETLKDYVLNRLRISAFDISETSCMEQYKRIKKFKPRYFYGYTTAIYGFGVMAKKLGLDLKKLNLKAVICTAEKMYPHHEELFKEIFDCAIVDEYGSSENGIISFQCKEGKMHLMSDHLCVEFLDKNNRQVKNGELGRIVITDLESFSMPLIRYDIGDMGRPTNIKCSCGINLPIMEIVEGRKEDFIRTKDGKLIHAAYLCYTLKEDSVHEFKMYQQDIDKLLVQIVKSPIFTNNTEKLLEGNLRSALGENMKIRFEYLDRIPREKSGKLRYFVSELSAN